MPTSHVMDRPGTIPADFSATLIETPGLPLNLTVSGKATGDYRVESVKLVRSHESTAHMLVLDVTEKLGPVENPHPEIERVFSLEYTEHPAKHRYTSVRIVNGSHHFTVNVIDVL